jgi:hypothetical protein
MTIDDYLAEIDYAVTRVIDALWHEFVEADNLRKQIRVLRVEMDHGYERAAFIANNADDPDDVMLGVGGYCETYFGPDKEQFYKTRSLEELEARLSSKEFSFSSLSGSLLQYAKQGLSVAYGKPENWPDGRQIGTQALKTVILEARNQAIHWEDGSPRQRVKDCFDLLAADIDSKFASYCVKNLAFDVVSILGWKTVGDFKAELSAMKPVAVVATSSVAP